MEAGVRRFQARHGLSSTGTMTGATVTAMNVPVDVRIRQLEINMGRLRSHAGNLGNRYVVVNIPAALVETVENGGGRIRAMPPASARATASRRSSAPRSSRSTSIRIWTVPASIIRKDLIPKMQKEPNYLTDNKIRIFNGANELSPSQVNWFSDEATRYRFRQDPGGELNSMGFVRINIPNPHGVYMHDTPVEGHLRRRFPLRLLGLRARAERARLHRLAAEGHARLEPRADRRAPSSPAPAPMRALPIRCNIYWTYMTAWATPDGLVQFRDDIYNKDGLGNAIPVASRVPTAPDEEMFLQN